MVDIYVGQTWLASLQGLETEWAREEQCFHLCGKLEEVERERGRVRENLSVVFHMFVLKALISGWREQCFIVGVLPIFSSCRIAVTALLPANKE